MEGITLYDLNKQAILKNEKPFSKKELCLKCQDVIGTYFNNKMKFNANYFMLLCHERRDYTVYRIINSILKENPTGLAASSIEGLLNNRGFVYSIEPTEDKNAIEIWVKPYNETDVFVYYLFPYNEGIVEV